MQTRITEPPSGAIRAPVLIVLGALIGVLTFVLVGCGPIANEKTRAAEADLKAAVEEALTDGVLGSAETQIILDRLDDVAEAIEEQAESINWKELLGAVGASAVATVLGLRAAPNSVILGREAGAALERVTTNGL